MSSNTQKHNSAVSSNTQHSVEENQNNSKFTNEELNNTPFRIIGSEEQGYAIALGKYRLTTLQPTKDKAIEQIS